MTRSGAVGPKFGLAMGLLQRLTRPAAGTAQRNGALPAAAPATPPGVDSGRSTFTAAPAAAPRELNPTLSGSGAPPPPAGTPEARAAAQQVVEVSPEDTVAERDRHPRRQRDALPVDE